MHGFKGFMFLGSALIAAMCFLSSGLCQDAALPQPRPVPQTPAATSKSGSSNRVVAPNGGPPGLPVPGSGAVPITFPNALRLALLSNLDIAQAREVVNAARAALQRAQVGFLPNFNIGSTYSEHEGNIQKTEGNIIKANKDALFVGGGTSVNFQFVDAIFGPLTARQVSLATQARLRRITDDTLLAVANAYFNVLRAERRLARIDETLRYLTADRTLPSGQRFRGLLPLVKDYVAVQAKEASRADLERVRVEVLRRQDERIGALDEYYTAVAELSRLLRLDPEFPLAPVEDFRYPLPIPGEPWFNQSVQELVAFATANRPELAENRALVQAALDRVRTAKFRPLLPNVVLNYNWGDFGGAPDPNPPIITPPAKKGGKPTVTTQPGFGPSGRINHFAPRQDVDIGLVWRLQNMGLGNRAEIREQEAHHRQAMLRNLQVQELVVTQVVQVREDVQSWRDRLRTTQEALFNAQGAPEGPVFQALRLDFERIRGAEGRPLEALDSIRRLSDLLEQYGTAATEYERSRFRLLVVLGVPPEALLDPSLIPPPGSPGACPPGPVAPAAPKAN